jgi:glycine cleavage system H protein
MSNIPSELRYAASHEWIKVEGAIGTVGITDHAQSELSDVVYVELPKVGTQVKAEAVVATIESVKAA